MSMERERIARGLADIETRFLSRVFDELQALRNIMRDVRAGDPTAIDLIHHLAHRIGGTSALLRFGGLSDAADRLARFAEAVPVGHRVLSLQHFAQLEVLVGAFETQLRAAAGGARHP